MEFFILRFKKVLAIPNDKVADLHDEFSDYRTLADHEIQTMAWKDSRVTEEDVPHYCMCYLGQMKESESQRKHFLGSQR